MRLFIGINVPQELHGYCRQLQKQFPGMKNVDEFHLTIQFLGDNIGEQFLPRILETLGSIDFEPFEVKLGVARRFPNERRPNGVWIDCDGGETLQKLANRIRKAMERVGFRPDKPFAPHITLGRYKNPSVSELRPRGGRPQSGRESICEDHLFLVDRFLLMESCLAPEGAEHQVLATFLA